MDIKQEILDLDLEIIDIKEEPLTLIKEEPTLCEIGHETQSLQTVNVKKDIEFPEIYDSEVQAKELYLEKNDIVKIQQEIDLKYELLTEECNLPTDKNEAVISNEPCSTQKVLQSFNTINKRKKKHLCTEDIAQESFNTLNHAIKRKKVEEDECGVYSKLIAKKLRKYPERMRDRIMYKIDGLLLDNPYPDL